MHNFTLISITGRVKLVPPEPADDEAVSILRSHPITRRYLQFLPPHISVEEIRARRESRENDPRILDFHVHVINEDGTTKFMGMSGIFNIDESNDSCEAGILIDPNTHRGGLATETLHTLLSWAFEERRFHRVTFETGVDNVGMRGWLEKVAGATLESEKRECWRIGPGKYIDVKGYSVLEREWKVHIKAEIDARVRKQMTA